MAPVLTKPHLELLVGCGHRREKLLAPPGCPLKWQNLVTLDLNERARPDILADLNDCEWMPIDWFQRSNQPVKIEQLMDMEKGRLKDCIFDEIHAYEVLEHLGSQGDAHAFFRFFEEAYRVLKPGGYFFATVPSRFSPWLWGDPSHRRAIIPETLVFLDQGEYVRQLDGASKSPMSDFRDIYKADFITLDKRDNNSVFFFGLQSVKPSRWKRMKND